MSYLLQTSPWWLSQGKPSPLSSSPIGTDQGRRPVAAAKSESDTATAFSIKVKEVILMHLEEESFGIAELSQALHLSRSQLHRKIKAELGITPSLFLRKVRLQEAKSLLEAEEGNISEIAFSVGMVNLAYFSRSFKAEFGYPPSKVRIKRKNLA